MLNTKFIKFSFNFVLNLTKFSFDFFSKMMNVDSNFSNPMTIVSSLSLKIITFMNISIYEFTSKVQQKLKKTTNAFLNIWNDNDGTINIFEKNWMFINIISNVKLNSSRVYSLDSQNKEFVNKKFDKLHVEKKLRWTTKFIFYEFSIFVIWKTIHLSNENFIKKNKTMINIHDLNKLAISNNYFMSLQFDVTSAISDCFYVNVMNVVEFFHQWLIKIIDKHKFTMISHRNNEQFNVAVMNYIDSFAYVQRQIDDILKKYRAFARVYVNNIVMFNKTLTKHINHLRKIFRLFKKMNIAFKSNKIYFDYFIVALLKQKINSLKLTTIKKKLKIISKLKFFITFKLLETYLKLIEWIKNYVLYYAQLFNFLQMRKTLILKFSLTKNAIRKRYIERINLKILIEAKIAFYEKIQKVFSKFIFLIHHDRFRKLFANVNVSHKRNFDVIIFHVKKNKNNFIKVDIELILFFNKILTFAKFKYWFIKLKIAELVWLIKKIRHMIKTSNSTSQVMIYIDYFVIINIVKQIKLSFFNIDKLNLKLIRTFIYLFQFRLNVRHKFEKQHIISNALFKLSSIVNFITRFFDFSKNILNMTYHVRTVNSTKRFSNISKVILNMIHHVTLIKMSQNFKLKFKNAYKQNKRWTRILNLLKSKSFSTNNRNLTTFIENLISNREHKSSSSNDSFVINNFITSINDFDILNETLFASAENLRFRYRNGLLYYVNELDDERKRLCIFRKLADEIFALIHDKLNHAKYHKTHDKIIASFYIRKLIKQLRFYVTHCSQCQIH